MPPAIIDTTDEEEQQRAARRGLRVPLTPPRNDAGLMPPPVGESNPLAGTSPSMPPRPQDGQAEGDQSMPSPQPAPTSPVTAPMPAQQPNAALDSAERRMQAIDDARLQNLATPLPKAHGIRAVGGNIVSVLGALANNPGIASLGSKLLNPGLDDWQEKNARLKEEQAASESAARRLADLARTRDIAAGRQATTEDRAASASALADQRAFERQKALLEPGIGGQILPKDVPSQMTRTLMQPNAAEPPSVSNLPETKTGFSLPMAAENQVSPETGQMYGQMGTVIPTPGGALGEKLLIPSEATKQARKTSALKSELSTREDATKANWPIITPALAAKYPDLQYKAGDKIDPAIYRELIGPMTGKLPTSPDAQVFQSIIDNVAAKEGKAPGTAMSGLSPAAQKLARDEFYSKTGRSTDLVEKLLTAQIANAQNQAAGGQISDSAAEMQAKMMLLTGKMPSLGMRNSAARTKILEKFTDLAQQQGMSAGDIIAVHREMEAEGKSLTAVSRLANQVGAFEKTASSNLDFALQKSNEVDRTGSPLLNKWLLAAKAGVFGDPDTRVFQQRVKTATDEYAKVVTSNGAAGVTSDASRAAYEGMLRAADSQEAFRALVASMKQEMANRTKGFADQQEELRAGIRTGGQQKQSPAPVAPMVEYSETRKQYRHSLDGGKTWLPGQPPK